MLRTIDWTIMVVYFVFVLGIGAVLKRYVKTSTDFFLAGRSIPAWVAGLAFLSANLGAQEVIGMGASGAKYGIATSHFYWIGAIPAMVFVGVFMMPFYYGSRARSVPEYLRLRFDEKTRGLNAVSFAIMTVFSSGISMYAMAKLIQILHIFDAPFRLAGPAAGLDISLLSGDFGARRSGLHPARRTDQRHLQRGSAVFPDRRRLPAAGLAGPEERRRLERAQSQSGPVLHALLAGHEQCAHQPAGRGVVRPDHGAGLCAFVWLLVHGFSGHPARHGRQLHEFGTPHAADRGLSQDALSVPGHSAGTDCDCASDAEAGEPGWSSCQLPRSQGARD